MCQMNTRKSIFFSKTSVRIQLNDTKGVKSQSLSFSHRLQPVFNSTSNLDTERVSSYYGCRYQAVNRVDLLSRSSNKIDSTPSCRNFTNKLDTKCISSCYSYHYQATNHVDLLNLSLVIIKPTLLDTDNNNFT